MIARPNLVDLAEVVGAVDPFVWSFLQYQLSTSDGVAVRDAGGRAVAVGGFYPMPGDVAEAWFVAGPGADRAMLGIIRAVRLTARGSGYRRIICRTGSAQGERIARLGGFRHLIGDIWRFDRGNDFRSWRSGEAGGTSGAAGSASGGAPGTGNVSRATGRR